MQYRLTKEALRILDLMHIGKAQYERLVNTVTSKQQVTVSRKADTIYFGNPEWFEEAFEYKKGEWNDCEKVRPPKTGSYLLRWPNSATEYEYAVTTWSLDGGFYVDYAANVKGAQFREMP